MVYIVVAAIGLLLVFEGILPLALPQLWRRLVIAMLAQSDRALRITGLVSMLLGMSIVLVAHYFL